MMTYLLVWGLGRVLFLTVAVPLFPTITTVNIVYPVSWFITAVILFVFYKKADWLHAYE